MRCADRLRFERDGLQAIRKSTSSLFSINWVATGELHPSSGVDFSNSGNLYQLAEGRIGLIGQLVSETINERTVPWVWSVIEFDASGNPYFTDHSIFPTYSIYENGSLIGTYPQSSVQEFTGLDESYQIVQSDIQ